jgi:hypothetical protein
MDHRHQADEGGVEEDKVVEKSLTPCPLSKGEDNL